MWRVLKSKVGNRAHAEGTLGSSWGKTSFHYLPQHLVQISNVRLHVIEIHYTVIHTVIYTTLTAV